MVALHLHLRVERRADLKRSPSHFASSAEARFSRNPSHLHRNQPHLHEPSLLRAPVEPGYIRARSPRNRSCPLIPS